MVSRAVTIVLAFVLICGCLHSKSAIMPTATHAVSPYQQFIAQNFDWQTVQRIVLMPVANQTSFPTVDGEMQVNLAAELQRAGRFEVVVATHDDFGARAQDVFASGQFNELEVLRIAREYQADAVLFANVTQYHPYSPPRVGVSLLLVSPAEGIAIASISGLWDTRETDTAKQAQAYFRQSQNWSRSLMGVDRVTESPDVFQRFVCQQIAVSLYPTANGVIGSSGTMMPPAGLMPPEGVMPVDGTMSNGSDLPPVPPPPMESQ